MEKVENKKQSLPLALLVSFCVCIAGAVLCGVIYYIGFISSWIAFITAYVAFMLFRKFYKVNFGSFVWVLFWTMALNEVAMFLAMGIAVSAQTGVGLSEVFGAINQLLNENAEFKNAFMSDTIFNVVFSFVGVLAFFVSIKISEKRQQRLAEQQVAESNAIQQTAQNIAQKTVSQSVSAMPTDKYKSDFNAIIKGLVDAVDSKDRVLFAEKLKLIYNTYILRAPNDEIEYFRNRAENLLQKPNLSITQEKVLNILINKML